MRALVTPGRHIVVIATIAYFALAVAGVLTAGRIVADGVQAQINRAADEAPRIVDEHAMEPDDQMRASVTKEIEAMGVMVSLRPRPPVPGGPPPPRPARPETSTQLGMIVFDIRPREVRARGGMDMQLYPSADRMRALLWNFSAGIAFLIALYAVLVTFLSRAANRVAMRPLHETTRALQELAGGNFVPRMIVSDGPDAMVELARAYNAAAERVAAAMEQRRQAEAEMRRFLADAGHELRTPLTILSGYLDIVGNGSSDAAIFQRIVTGMRDETSRMRTLVEKLLLLVRLESTQPQTSAVDVVAVARSVVGRLSAVAGSRSIELEAPPAAHVSADGNDLYEALFNLVDNAIKYGGGSDVMVRVEAHNDGVSVSVHDGGPGIDPEDQQHLFERFYRGKQRAEIEGSGLGLAIVKRAVERCGGTLEFSSRPPQGTTFAISLARESKAAA